MQSRDSNFLTTLICYLPSSMRDYLLHSNFAQDILKLATGGTVVTGIGFLLTPIYTRLFSPEDYGLFYLVISIGMFFSVLSSFNLAPVILMEKRDRTARAIATLCTILLPISVIFSSFILWFFSDYFLQLLNAEEVAPYLWLVYIMIFLNGAQMLTSQIVQRERRYGLISKSRILSSLLNHAIRLSWGCFSPSFIALYVANLTSTILGFLWTLKYAIFSPVKHTKYLFYLFKKNFTFMFSQSINAIFSVISLQLPIFWIASVCDAVSVGYYGIALTLVDTPCNLLYHAFQSAYDKRIADTVSHQPQTLMQVYWRSTWKLTLLSLIPLILIMAATPLMPLFLSEKWAAATPIIQLLVIWRLMRFVVMPCYAVSIVLRKTHRFIHFNIYSLLATLGGLYIGYNNIPLCIFYIIVFHLPHWAMLLWITHRYIKIEQNRVSIKS